MELSAEAAAMPPGSVPTARGKARLLTVGHLDKRTRASRRSRELARAFEAEIGGVISATQRLAIERAAALVALAEDAQARRLAGDPSVTLDDVVRIDGAAQRAVRRLGIEQRKRSAGPAIPSLAELIRRTEAAKDVAK